jgi:hypothetical protein
LNFSYTVATKGHSIADEMQNLTSKKSSNKLAQKFFEWLIAPLTVDEFYSEYWEKKPLIIKRNNLIIIRFSSTNFFILLFEQYHVQGWFDKKDIENALIEKDMKYGEHLDITKYTQGKRKTLNPSNGKKATPEEGVI